MVKDDLLELAVMFEKTDYKYLDCQILRIQAMQIHNCERN